MSSKRARETYLRRGWAVAAATCRGLRLNAGCCYAIFYTETHRVLRPEAAMQPFTAEHMVFRPDASFPVEVFTDVQDGVGTRIAQGTLTMGKMVFVDCVDLNEENFFKTPRSVAGEKTWAEVVKEKLGRGVLG
ncbi:hypothetical protein B0H12DRAFT_1236510 [Mycena haematopus]|nr:hypothetical protein B0H12DRAFT_1236510 [Mycena haematopus]